MIDNVLNGTVTEEDVVLQKYFSFDQFLDYFKQTSSSQKKKTRQVNKVELYMKLYDELLTRKYNPSRYGCFFVKDPKPREIFAPNFNDRIIHHMLVDMLSGIEKVFIDDSFANRYTPSSRKMSTLYATNSTKKLLLYAM
jgi:hypothetical protein